MSRDLTVPVFGDTDELTEVTAFMLESFRWRPVSAGGASRSKTFVSLIWKNIRQVSPTEQPETFSTVSIASQPAQRS